MLADAHAFWLRAPGHGEIRPVPLPEPGPADVVVRTLRSGVSRGTETWDRRRRRRGRRRRDVSVLRTCQSCGDRRAIGEPRPYRSVGELRLYRSVGVVLRCPACEDAGVVLGVHEKRLVVEWRGRYDIAR